MSNDAPTIETLIEQADTAMDASECEMALDLYGAAGHAIQSALESVNENEEEDTTMNDNNDGNDKGLLLLLARILGRSGEAQVSLGDVESGRENFLEAISILDGPGLSSSSVEEGNGDGHNIVYDVRASMHLYLAQLSTAEEALSEYRRGISELEKYIRALEQTVVDEDDGNEVGPKEALMEARKQLCSAHCSIGELYLTDLCFAPDAESQCEAALTLALKHDIAPSTNNTNNTNHYYYSHPDALQALANLRISQSRGVEAAEIMMEAYERMKNGCVSMSKLVGLANTDSTSSSSTTLLEEEEQGALELENVEEATSLPGFEFRCQSAKLLLECGAILEEASASTSSNNGNVDTSGGKMESQQCCEAAVQVLGSLMAENDEVVETWYLLGCAFQQLHNEELARHYWEQSLQMLGEVKKGLEQGDVMESNEDDDMKAQLEELDGQMKDVQEKLQGLEDMEEEA